MIALRNIHTYYGKSHILQGVDIDVPAGAVVSLMGRNGVGKTTTMRTIMGLAKPARGQVMLEDRDVTGFAPYRLAEAGIGYVPENRQVFPRLTVLENLRIGLDMRKWSEADKRKSLGLVYESFPRLRERESQIGSTLSGGEQQMLAMARAIVVRPKLILLDEPTEGLMPAMVAEIERIIRWMRDELKITILLVEQDYRLSLRVSSYCYLMAKGRVVHHDSSANVANDEAVLKSCLGCA